MSDEIKSVIESGLAQVKSVQDQLKTAIDLVKRDLFEQAVDTGLWPGAPRQIRVTTGKGF